MRSKSAVLVAVLIAVLTSCETAPHALVDLAGKQAESAALAATVTSGAESIADLAGEVSQESVGTPAQVSSSKLVAVAIAHVEQTKKLEASLKEERALTASAGKEVTKAVEKSVALEVKIEKQKRSNLIAWGIVGTMAIGLLFIVYFVIKKRILTFARK